MANRIRTVGEFVIKRWYGGISAREVLLEKVQLWAAVALFVAAEEEEDSDEEGERLSFVAGVLAASVCEDGIDLTLYG